MSDSVVIVLDPGHGGENHGLEYGGFLEKEMNLKVAKDIKEELEKYENTIVYITNPECQDMSLKQRAEYAKSVEADLLVSLHFNMSEEHQVYGSEVWIPSRGENHTWMRSLGDIFTEEFREQGLVDRGVKVRLNSKGKDYYGIIRESTALEVPSILVEHCYADHEKDIVFLNEDNSLHNFAMVDARAIAKFFRLKSVTGEYDYSDYVKNAYMVPEDTVRSDETGPENVQLYHIKDETIIENDSTSFLLTAEENESNLCYYDYSLDGGKTWSQLEPWPYKKESVIFEVPKLPVDAVVIARVYNGYVLTTESNYVKFSTNEVTELSDEVHNMEERQEELSHNNESKQLLFDGIGFVGFAISLLLLLIVMKNVILQKKRMDYKIIIAVIICMCITFGSFEMSRKTKTKQALYKNNEMKIQEETVETFQVLNIQNKKNEIEKNQAELLAEQPKSLHKTEMVYDIQRGYLNVDSIEELPRNNYHFDRMIQNGELKYYTDEAGNIVSKIGIDASKYQGNIEWNKVKASGIDFAMLRLGVRGYGSGKLVMDDLFYQNMEGAKENGIQVGVYFFSAAISEEEAVEEADFVADALSGYEIEMPVVFDTEPVFSEDSRIKDLTPDRLTSYTRAFCDRIKEHGFTPMIYANAKHLTCMLHLEELSDISLWYADYQEKPIYPYQYDMWQYTEHGRVDGIEGEVDLNVYFK